MTVQPASWPPLAPAIGGRLAEAAAGRLVESPAEEAAARPGPAENALAARLAALHGARPAVDLLITANDMNMEHGSGILMTRIMEEAPDFIAMRAFNHWGGFQTIKPKRQFVFDRYAEPDEVIARFAANRLDFFDIRSIVAVCFTREDAVMAITARKLTGAELAVYVMDDNGLLTDGIPRPLLDELFALADRRFVISRTMREAYEPAFGHSFHILPPVVHPKFMSSAPVERTDARRRGPAKAAIVGNIWHHTWLESLLQTVTGADIAVDWFIGVEAPSWLSLDRQRLAAAGITLVPRALPEQIAATLESADVVVVPSSDGRETDQHARAIARLSLPSKLPFIVASAGTPVLVLHDDPSGAADFVRDFDLGRTCPYDRDAFEAALKALTEPAEQRRLRRRAFEIAPHFSSHGVYDLLTGRHGADPGRFDTLFAANRKAA